MTRKDFILIADILRKVKKLKISSKTFYEIVKIVEFGLRSNNSRFDDIKFIKRINESN